MTSWVYSIKQEFFKLFSKKKYIILFIISTGFCLLRMGGSMLLERISQGEIQLRSNIMLEMLPFTAEILVPLIVFMAAADLFCSEFQEDTMKAALLRPATRIWVFASKVAAIFLMGAGFFLGMFLVCAIIQAISGNPFLSVVLPTLGAYLIDLVPMLGLVLLGVLVNMISAGPTLSMLLSIGVYAVAKYANFYITSWGQAIFTAYLQWHKLWVGEMLPFGALMAKIGIVLGTMVIFFTAAYILFDRKEL